MIQEQLFHDFEGTNDLVKRAKPFLKQNFNSLQHDGSIIVYQFVDIDENPFEDDKFLPLGIVVPKQGISKRVSLKKIVEWFEAQTKIKKAS